MRIRAKDSVNAAKRTAPGVLLIAQIVLLVALFRYLYILNYIIYPAALPLEGSWMTYVYLAYCLPMSLLVIDAMIGITSSRPDAWAKVVRTATLMLLSNIAYTILNLMGYGSLAIYASTLYVGSSTAIVVVIAMLTVMFLPSVRKFYTPVMQEVPPIKDWLKLVVYIPLFDAESYRFVSKEELAEELSESEPE